VYFDVVIFAMFVVGGLLMVSAKYAASPKIPTRPGSEDPPVELRNPFQLWTMRVAGLLVIAAGMHAAMDAGGRYQTEMGKEENKIALLERGRIVEGKVTKAYDQPEWGVHYKFVPQDADAAKGKEFSGYCEGPKKYYSGLSPGDSVVVIYLPDKPRINGEIRWFLNCPYNRKAFKEAGKLGLLNKFGDRYDLDDYSDEEWFKQQREK
jgi:hypothetical protein